MAVCFTMPVLRPYWPFAARVELIWALVTLCSVKTDRLDGLVVCLALGGALACLLVWLATLTLFVDVLSTVLQVV